jgi:hypothetical protein
MQEVRQAARAILSCKAGRCAGVCAKFLIPAISPSRKRLSHGDVRYGAHNGLISDIAACPRSANSGLVRRGKQHRYSITSSALSRMDVGSVTPSAFAVLRFAISLKRVGRSMGKSAAEAPCNNLRVMTPACGYSSSRSGP